MKNNETKQQQKQDKICNNEFFFQLTFAKKKCEEGKCAKIQGNLIIVIMIAFKFCIFLYINSSLYTKLKKKKNKFEALLCIYLTSITTEFRLNRTLIADTINLYVKAARTLYVCINDIKYISV